MHAGWGVAGRSDCRSHHKFLDPFQLLCSGPKIGHAQTSGSNAERAVSNFGPQESTFQYFSPPARGGKAWSAGGGGGDVGRVGAGKESAASRIVAGWITEPGTQVSARIHP
jgi:hypothetical protein